jgi:hypothetical protein
LQMVVLVLGFSEHLGLLVLHVDVGLRGKCDETRTQMDHVFVRNRLGESGAMPLWLTVT